MTGTVEQEFRRKKEELNHLRKEALENREEYWSSIAKTLSWTKKWDTVCDLSDAPITKWFTGGEINMCYNCVDRHINAGFGSRIAFYYDSPVTKKHEAYSYSTLYDKVTSLAGVLKEFGVKKGDRILIYMPMIPEGVFAMLASCRIGATHCCIPSGLPAQDLAAKIDHAKPKVILMATSGYHANGWVNYKDIMDNAFSLVTCKPDKVLVYQRAGKVNFVPGRDVDWDSAVKVAKPMLECIPMEATDPLFVIYTSGSTGNPKGVVHAVGGYAVKMAHDTQIMTDGLESNNEVHFMTTSLGWIAGHSVLLYCPFILRQSTVVFEGDPLLTEDVNTLYGVIERNLLTRVTVRAGILRILKLMDPDGVIASRFKLGSLRLLQYGGETLDSDTIEWAAKIFDAPIWNSYGQTEGIQTYLLTMAGVRVVPFICDPEEMIERSRVMEQVARHETANYITATLNLSAIKNKRRVYTSIPYPGYDVAILKSDHTEAKTLEIGHILLKLPLPPGGIVTLLDDHDKCQPLYFDEFPGYFDTKDVGYLDEDGSLHIEGRSDSMMKHAAVYLSGTAVENVVLTHPEVSECAVISTPDLILKEIPVTLYTVSKDKTSTLDQISKQLLEISSKHFGEAVTFGKFIAIPDLPRTRTGKIQRASITALIKGHALQTGGLENPEVLDDIAIALKNAGYIN